MIIKASGFIDNIDFASASSVFVPEGRMTGSGKVVLKLVPDLSELQAYSTFMKVILNLEIGVRNLNSKRYELIQ